MLSIVSISIIVVLFYNYSTDFTQYKVDNIKSWSLEFYYNFESEGKLFTQSSDQVFQSLTLPDRALTWLFGNGDYSDRSHGTDSGYLRILFTIGLFGTLIHYYVFIVLMNRSVYCTRDIAYKCWLYSLYIVLFLVEIKEPFLIKPLIAKALLMFLFSSTIWINTRGKHVIFN